MHNWCTFWWVISLIYILRVSKVTRNSNIWLLLLKRHQIFLENVCFTKEESRWFGDCILKQNVFSEELAKSFPSNCSNKATEHQALLTNLLVRCLLLVTVYILKKNNYRFVHVNVSKMTSVPKRVLILPLKHLGWWRYKCIARIAITVNFLVIDRYAFNIHCIRHNCHPLLQNTL